MGGKWGGGLGWKNFSSRHNKIFSCEILFSSESCLYLGALTEFSNFMPVTMIQAHLSKINKPSCSINYAAAEERL